jgi:hypothetical protein
MSLMDCWDRDLGLWFELNFDLLFWDLTDGLLVLDLGMDHSWELLTPLLRRYWFKSHLNWDLWFYAFSDCTSSELGLSCENLVLPQPQTCLYFFQISLHLTIRDFLKVDK